MTDSYICYIIVSFDSSRTYVGITNNMAKRLRQHNGELKGGAKYTHIGRPWRIACIIEGFQDHHQVLQFEWALKYQTKLVKKEKKTPLQRRGLALLHLIHLDRWTSNSVASSDVHLKIHWYNTYMKPTNYTLPLHVTEKI